VAGIPIRNRGSRAASSIVTRYVVTLLTIVGCRSMAVTVPGVGGYEKPSTATSARWPIVTPPRSTALTAAYKGAGHETDEDEANSWCRHRRLMYSKIRDHGLD
jgi:hypothetical protein